MLIIISGILLFLYGLKKEKTWGEAFADSIWFLVLFAYVITEICSCFHAISSKVMNVIWISLALLLFSLLVLNKKRRKDLRNKNTRAKQRDSGFFRGCLCRDDIVVGSIDNFKLGFNDLSYAKSNALDPKQISRFLCNQ